MTDGRWSHRCMQFSPSTESSFGCLNFKVSNSELFVIREDFLGEGIRGSLNFADFLPPSVIPALGSGSDAASLLTSAKRQGDHYVLNGSKVQHVLFPGQVRGCSQFCWCCLDPCHLWVNVPMQFVHLGKRISVPLCLPWLFLSLLVWFQMSSFTFVCPFTVSSASFLVPQSV